MKYTHTVTCWLSACVLAFLGSLSCRAETNHVYILTGQSNSLGAVKGSPASAEQLEHYKSEALLWNGNMQRDSGEPFEKSPEWKTVAPQLPDYHGGLCMGPEYGFGSMMQRRGWHAAAGDRICVIKASLDGGGNSHWCSDAASYKSLVDSATKALAALKGKPVVHELLYLQGESDSGNEISAAPERFVSLMTRLPKDIGKSGLKQAVVGECATWGGKDGEHQGKKTVQLMHELSLKKKNIGWVRTRDLPKITVGDNMQVHYNGHAQIAIGARYAYAVALLEKLPVGCVRGDDPEARLDSPAAWWGGKLPKPDRVVSWDISAANVSEEKLGKNWTVGGLSVEDPFGGCVTVKLAGTSATLTLGKKGISLLGEGDLVLQVPLSVSADQTWKLAEGRHLTIGTESSPVALSGSARISLQVNQGAKLEMHLTAAPEVTWLLPAPLPDAVLSVDGKPARFVQQGDAYIIKPSE